MEHNKGVNEFEIWEIEELNGLNISDLSLDKINHDGCLEIVLDSNKYNIVITIERYISFRVTDESYLLEYWEEMSEPKENLSFSKMPKSSFFNEIAFLSKNFFVDGGADEIQHFGIFTLNECVEIISDMTPIVKVNRK